MARRFRYVVQNGRRGVLDHVTLCRVFGQLGHARDRTELKNRDASQTNLSRWEPCSVFWLNRAARREPQPGAESIEENSPVRRKKRLTTMRIENVIRISGRLAPNADLSGCVNSVQTYWGSR